jgi:dTDP-4-dehydrorhamnose 3,5-epimerase
MIFEETSVRGAFLVTSVRGAFLVQMEKKEDARGYFARSFCLAEFKAHGLNPHVVQCSVSVNRRKGTLRGLHYQAAPHEETKLVRCTRGAIYDVVLDLRRDSETFLRHVAVELTEHNGSAIYIPANCAHGFVTMADETEVLYQMSAFHAPESARGARWNDPTFAIQWPVTDPILNERDRLWEDFQVLV